MTLWLMGQYLRAPQTWALTLLGVMVILRWPVVGASTSILIIQMQLLMLPGRATLFDAALPISARDLVAARMLSRLLLIAAPVLACAASWSEGLAVAWPLSRFLEVAAIATLALLLPIGVRPAVLGLSVTHAYVWPLGLLAVVSALVVWLLPPAVGAMLFGAALVGLVVRTISTTPAAFERVDTAGSNDAQPVGVAPHAERTVPWLSMWRPLLRSMTPWPVLMHFSFMLLFGWLRSNELAYLVILSVTAHQQLRQRSAWLNALPLSHRARLWVLAIPFCLGPLSGLAIGRSLPTLSDFDRGLSAGAPYSLYEGSRYFSSETRVPLTWWHSLPSRTLPNGATPSGRQVEIMSPWGERAIADTISILGTMYFNPYSTNSGSSARMVDWQFGRATKAVYGRSLTRGEYANDAIPRPYRVTDAWDVQLIGGGLMLALMFYVLLVYEIPHSAPASRRSPMWRAWVGISPLFVPFYIIGAIVLYAGHKRGGDIAVPMINRALLAATRTLPDNVLVVLLVAVIPPALVYAALEWQARRSEHPMRAAVKR